jgi:RND superfamily putative drug exporter
VAALARWCFRHRFLVLVFWIVGLGVIGAVGNSLGTQYANSFSLPNTDSTKALTLLQHQEASQSGDQDTLVWHTSSGTVRDAGVQQRMTATMQKIAKMPEVAAVRSPYGPGGAVQISKDGTTAYATVAFTEQAAQLTDTDVQNVISTAQAAGTSGLEVEMTGNAVDQVAQGKPSSSEALGILAAGIILFITFGSLFAMLLPILTAVFGLGAGLLTVDLLTHAFSVASLAPTLSALIGLGVGIDYAVFIVTRHRRNLQRGMEAEDSAALALNTSGRAVLFAGGTVCIALLGMLVLGISFLNGVAIAAAITVLFTVLAATTLLPAMLGILKMRVLSRRQRRRLAERGPEPAESTGFWARWAGIVQKWPRSLAVVALAVMVVLVIPIHSLFLGHSDDGTSPASSTSRKAYDLLADGFGPGFNGPLQIVVDFGQQNVDPADLTRLEGALAKTPDVSQVQAIPAQPGAKIALMEAYPTTAPGDKATSDLISTLRSSVIPQAVSGTPMTVYVSGSVATFYDFAHVLDGKLPEFIAIIIALGCLLLLFAFRSFGIPLTAAVMNLLSAGASFGVLVAVFEWGHGLGVLGLGSSGPIEAFLPVLLLSILFGLSMDYQVFLVSRMHEEWAVSKDTHRAVRIGQAETGRVISAAATIMICVFISFIFLGQRVVEEFGIGLAVAVALDAFIVRTVLVPACMHLIGRANWWIPKRLDRVLPHLSVDPADPVSASEPAVAGVDGQISAELPRQVAPVSDPSRDDARTS